MSYLRKGLIDLIEAIKTLPKPAGMNEQFDEIRRRLEAAENPPKKEVLMQITGQDIIDRFQVKDPPQESECAAGKKLTTREEWLAASQNIWDAIIPDQKPLNPIYEREYVEGLADAIQSLITQPCRPVMTREYSCGCTATGPIPLPPYCPEHKDDTRILDYLDTQMDWSNDGKLAVIHGFQAFVNGPKPIREVVRAAWQQGGESEPVT